MVSELYERAERQPGRIDFATPIDNVVELQTAMFALITRARSLSGEEALTSAEREAAELATVRTFVAEVVAASDVPRRNPSGYLAGWTRPAS